MTKGYLEMLSLSRPSQAAKGSNSPSTSPTRSRAAGRQQTSPVNRGRSLSPSRLLETNPRTLNLEKHRPIYQSEALRRKLPEYDKLLAAYVKDSYGSVNPVRIIETEGALVCKIIPEADLNKKNTIDKKPLSWLIKYIFFRLDYWQTQAIVYKNEPIALLQIIHTIKERNASTLTARNKAWILRVVHRQNLIEIEHIKNYMRLSLEAWDFFLPHLFQRKDLTGGKALYFKPKGEGALVSCQDFLNPTHENSLNKKLQNDLQEFQQLNENLLDDRDWKKYDTELHTNSQKLNSDRLMLTNCLKVLSESLDPSLENKKDIRKSLAAEAPNLAHIEEHLKRLMGKVSKIN